MLDKTKVRYIEVDKDNIQIGDIIFINHAYYICLYIDKLQTILVRKEENPSFNSIAVIPTKDQYNKAGRTSRDELIKAYNVFITYRGVLRGRSMDNVERTMKRILAD